MAGRKLVVVFAAAAALLAAVPASGAEVTPQEYKEQVEPICKKDTEANERILDGVRANVKAGKFKQASRQLSGAARALKRARAELLQVPKPVEDAARLTKWLQGVKVEAELFETAARKLAKGEKNGAQKMIVRLYSNATKTNNQVLDYEFRYCRLQPSKFV
ncbi:MAG TPA: hypothetical protein VFS64_09940 [Solirubrobacterales bacterium]|nr:hypothetical protein [Solirubrobacterales bacterium]